MKSPFHGFLAAALILTFLGTMTLLEAISGMAFLPEATWLRGLMFTGLPALGFVMGAFGGQSQNNLGKQEMPIGARIALGSTAFVVILVGAAFGATSNDPLGYDREPIQSQQDCWAFRVSSGQGFRWQPPTLFEELTDSHETAEQGTPFDVRFNTTRLVWNATWSDGPDTIRFRLEEKLQGQWSPINSWAAESGQNHTVGYHAAATELRFTADTMDSVEESLQVLLAWRQLEIRC